ncbi:MAG: V-type ATPase subunit [Brevinema sp.]
MISVQYIPLSVRVRAWNVSLFSKNDLMSFIEEDSVAMMAHVVQKENKIEMSTDSPAQFIKSLKQSLLYYLNVATHLTSAEGKGVMTELTREFEVENLKLLARMIISGKHFGDFIDVEFATAIPHHRYLEIRSIHDFTNLLQGTIYESLIPSLQKTEQEKNTMFFETALDNFYHARLVMSIRKIDQQSRLNAKKLYLLPLQFEQLVTIFRYRFHYEIDPVETSMLVPNVFHLLNPESWKKIVYSPTPLDFLKQINEIYHLETQELTDATELRLIFRKKTEQLCRQQMHKGLTELSSFLAFYQLKKIQFQKIATILEAKSLKIGIDVDMEQFI